MSTFKIFENFHEPLLLYHYHLNMSSEQQAKLNDFEAHRIFFGTFVYRFLVLLVHKFLTFFWANTVY